jgi:hypothetical protein
MQKSRGICHGFIDPFLGVCLVPRCEDWLLESPVDAWLPYPGCPMRPLPPEIYRGMRFDVIPPVVSRGHDGGSSAASVIAPNLTYFSPQSKMVQAEDHLFSKDINTCIFLIRHNFLAFLGEFVAPLHEVEKALQRDVIKINFMVAVVPWCAQSDLPAIE